MEVDTWSHPYSVSRHQAHDFAVEPLYTAEIQLNEDEHDDEDLSNAFTKKFSFYFAWPTEQTLPEFLDTLKDVAVEEGNAEDREYADNSLRWMPASAYFDGSSGDNTLDYEGIVQKPISEIRKLADEEDIRWDRLFAEEKQNKDRKTLKEWINRKRVEENGYAYDDFGTTLAKVMDDENYPERVNRLDLSWMSEDTTWSEGAEDLFLDIENEEELNQIALHYTEHQNIPIEDGEYVHRIDMSEPSTEDIRTLLPRTIPEYLVEQAAEQHGYDSTDAVLNDALDEAEGRIMDEYNQFRWKEGEELQKLG